MIQIELFLSFLQIGLFSFGGAYGAIPLIQEVVAANGWADAEMFTNLVALSEATPGPIMVNMATYIGSRQAGLFGALCATVGVVLPSFVIILIVTAVFQNLLKRKGVQAVLKGVKPCLMGVILATGTYMVFSSCTTGGLPSLDLAACMILFILLAAIVFYRKFRKKEVSPIALLIVAAVCGCMFY